MKLRAYSITPLLLIFTVFGSTAQAVTYGTIAFPNGVGPVHGYPRDMTHTISTTDLNDFDDVQALSVAAQGLYVNQILNGYCVSTKIHISDVYTVINERLGLTLTLQIDWPAPCFGFFPVISEHVLFLDNGESYVETSESAYGFFP